MLWYTWNKNKSLIFTNFADGSLLEEQDARAHIYILTFSAKEIEQYIYPVHSKGNFHLFVTLEPRKI